MKQREKLHKQASEKHEGACTVPQSQNHEEL